MKKYRKLPVEIDAIRVPDFGEDPTEELVNLVQDNGWIPEDEYIIIPTLEGNMTASPNDYIIRGVNGEYYPCKPDIFEKTYEEV